MTLRILATILLAAASPAAALTNCTFTTECVDTDACAPAEFYLEVLNGDSPRLSTIFGDLDVVAETGTEAAASWLATGQGMTVLLSRYADGAARASVHMPDLGMIGYVGRCEG